MPKSKTNRLKPSSFCILRFEPGEIRTRDWWPSLQDLSGQAPRLSGLPTAIELKNPWLVPYGAFVIFGKLVFSPASRYGSANARMKPSLGRACFSHRTQRIALSLVIGLPLYLLSAAGIAWSDPVAARAETLYVTNLNQALTMARETGRLVMLYTGRAELCVSNSPRQQLDVILVNHPKLASRANRYVICEQFGYSPGKDTNGNMTAGFMRDMRTLEPLLDRYDIRFFWPTLTFLNERGERLNGPFSQVYSEYAGFVGYSMHSNGRDCYDTLEDYAEDERPVRLDQAQIRLVAAVLHPTGGENKLGFFRFMEQTNRTAPPLLMENGLISRKIKLGEPFAFVVRDCTNMAFAGSAKQWPFCWVEAAGRFAHGEPFEGPFVLELNGVHFIAKTIFTGQGPDYTRGFGNMKLREGEYYFSIETRPKAVGDTMLEALKHLQKSRLGIDE